MNNAPIGIFDSGVGGLTVAGAIFTALPQDSTIYFGDTARVPYGPKSPRTVTRYSHEILDWLLGQGVKAVVVACNTSTAHALPSLVRSAPVPVVGVVEPGARAAVEATRTGRIGVIGTVGTINSSAYEQAIQRLLPKAVVLQQSCPLLVPLAEEGWFDHPAAELIALEYLAFLMENEIDTLVLGCTHYPLLKPLLSRILGPEVTLIDSAEQTARAVGDVLTQLGLQAAPDVSPTHRFFVSDEEDRFLEVGRRFLGEWLLEAERVDLGSRPVKETG